MPALTQRQKPNVEDLRASVLKMKNKLIREKFKSNDYKEYSSLMTFDSLYELCAAARIEQVQRETE